MKEKWTIQNKSADFHTWAKELHCSELLCKIIRNRDIETLEDAKEYLYGTMDSLKDPYLLKDMDKAVALISEKVQCGERIAISSDYDDDGIFSGQILREGIRNIGGRVVLFSPNRTTEGYGLNQRIVDDAKKYECTMILTCDNGIAAFEAVDYAKEQGFQVVVTDHHEVQYEETENGRKYLLPNADAIIDPKRIDSEYPFREYCGAGVAFRLIQALYEKFQVPKEKEKDLYEYLAIATVADVVSLRGENRIMVRAGLEALHRTKKVPLLALCKAQNLRPEEINSYHIGFVIGPCFNAIGRLGNINLAFQFLGTTDFEAALKIATYIKSLNDERKLMTEEGFQKCIEQIESAPWKNDRVYAILLEGVHESIVGIIAGRVKEKYNRPVFVFTKTDEGFLKGSGRSISAYNMVEELIKVKPLLLRFGGHKMAAGLSLSEENFEEFRRMLNENTTLTDDDLVASVVVDANVLFYGMNERFVNELNELEPFGMGNPKPLFCIENADILNLSIRGKTRQITTMLLADSAHYKMSSVCFQDPEEFLSFLNETFTEEKVQSLMARECSLRSVSFTFYPTLNEYRGTKSTQIVIENYCKETQFGL